jgi:hypothetical protein
MKLFAPLLESTDYTTQLAATALTHEALDAPGSRYPLTKLAEATATRPDLATAVPEWGKCGTRSPDSLFEWIFRF